MPFVDCEFRFAYTSVAYGDDPSTRHISGASPFLTVIEDGTLKGYLRGKEKPSITTELDEFVFGQSPIHWAGEFSNTATSIRLQLPYREHRFFYPQMFDRLKYEPLSYAVFQGEAPIDAGELPQDGSVSPEIPLPSKGAYTMEITYEQYRLRQHPGHARVTVTFDTSLEDKDPPALRFLNVTHEGVTTDILPVSGASEIRFGLEDSSGLSSASLFYSYVGEWNELPLTHADSVYAAQVPLLPDGVYVSLRINAQDLAGNSLTYEITPAFQICDPPTAAFTALPTSGVAPLAVDFTNESTGEYDTCAWDFGDGGTSTDCNDPSYTYESAGTYTIALTVSGDAGSDTVTRTDYITVYEAVQADFAASPVSGLGPLTVAFTNLSTGDYDTCSWDFGDGGTSTDCNDSSHDYTSPGTYTVALTVSGLGGTDNATRPEYISVETQTHIYLPYVVRRNASVLNTRSDVQDRRRVGVRHNRTPHSVTSPVDIPR